MSNNKSFCRGLLAHIPLISMRIVEMGPWTLWTVCYFASPLSIVPAGLVPAAAAAHHRARARVRAARGLRAAAAAPAGRRHGGPAAAAHRGPVLLLRPLRPRAGLARRGGQALLHRDGGRHHAAQQGQPHPSGDEAGECISISATNSNT